MRGARVPITTTRSDTGIVTVTVDYPPVNALPSAAWFELADAILAAGDDLVGDALEVGEVVSHCSAPSWGW